MKLVVFHVKEKDWEKAHGELFKALKSKEYMVEKFKPMFPTLATSGYVERLTEFLKAIKIKYHRAHYDLSSETASNPEAIDYFVSDAFKKAERMFLEKPKFLTWELVPDFEEDPDPEQVTVPEEEVQFVKGSERQRAYWRKKPYHYMAPTIPMREVRRMLTKTASTKGRDKFGTAEITDKKGVEKTVPASAVPIKEKMEGLRVAKPKPVVVPVPHFTTERLRKLAEILSRIPT